MVHDSDYELFFLPVIMVSSWTPQIYSNAVKNYLKNSNLEQSFLTNFWYHSYINSGATINPNDVNRKITPSTIFYTCPNICIEVNSFIKNGVFAIVPTTDRNWNIPKISQTTCPMVKRCWRKSAYSSVILVPGLIYRMWKKYFDCCLLPMNEFLKCTKIFLGKRDQPFLVTSQFTVLRKAEQRHLPSARRVVCVTCPTVKSRWHFANFTNSARFYNRYLLWKVLFVPPANNHHIAVENKRAGLQISGPCAVGKIRQFSYKPLIYILQNCEVELYNILVTWVGDYSNLYNSKTELYNFVI